MIIFLGNCQADFVCEEMKRRGYDAKYRVLASPLTYTSHPGAVPASLGELELTMGLNDYFQGRELCHQFAPVDDYSTPLEAIVLSLFHENTPLFIHNEEEYVFYMSTQALTDKPEMMQWAQDNCRMFKPNPATYLERFAKMLFMLRKTYPGVPIVILQRLSHYPAFGPDPFSYLEEWDQTWVKADETLSTWASTINDVHILDMNRVFGGMWNSSDTGINTHCPFLKIKLEEKDGQVVGLHAQRDIEHIGPMPARLAEKMVDFIEAGVIEYDEAETVPHTWRRHWRPVAPDRDSMLAKLRSGANYQGAEAVAGFFLDLGNDYTDLLVQAKSQMPVCHMTLHMIKAYGRIHRNPALAEWCDAHLEAATLFTGNGKLYQEAYIKRVESMKEYALGRD